MTRVIEIESIGKVYAEKLTASGISTVETLLHAGSTAAKRKQLAELIGVDDSRVLEWVNRADLMRIQGVGSEFADLLETAGVDSVPELAQRNPANLHAVMEQMNETKDLTRRMPGLKQVERWVADAKGLPKVVTH